MTRSASASNRSGRSIRPFSAAVATSPGAQRRHYLAFVDRYRMCGAHIRWMFWRCVMPILLWVVFSVAVWYACADQALSATKMLWQG